MIPAKQLPVARTCSSRVASQERIGVDMAQRPRHIAEVHLAADNPVVVAFDLDHNLEAVPIAHIAAVGPRSLEVDTIGLDLAPHSQPAD